MSAILKPEELFARGFRIEQDLGPEVYRDVMQATNVLVNSNPSGRLLSRSEFRLRAACLAWVAGVYGEQSLSDVLKELTP